MKYITLFVLLFTMGCSNLAKNNFFANPKEPSGQIILVSNKITQSLFSVTLLNINGKEVARRNNAFWLKPGTYTLKFAANIDHRFAGGNGINVRNIRPSKNQSKNSLNVTIKADRKYYIAYDASDANQKNWKPIIWKQE